MTSITVLDRPTKEATTQDGVVKETETELLKTVGGIEDSSLIIIENPLVFGKTGLLACRSFEIHSMEARLFGVEHYRIDQNQKFGTCTRKSYRETIIKRGECPLPHIRMTTGNGEILPLPSVLPYQLNFISPSQYGTLKNLLGNEKFFQRGAEMAFQIAATNSPYFRYRNGKLEMPREYASMRMR